MILKMNWKSYKEKVRQENIDNQLKEKMTNIKK